MQHSFGSFSALEVSHKIISEHVKPGDFCIDATAGRGRDTVFLCGLAGNTGRVIAFDIQDDAIESTKKLVEAQGYAGMCTVIQDCHSNMTSYAGENSVSCITYNFGWLPAGDHHIFTRAETSIPSIEQGLRLLQNGGLMSLCIYYGRESGFEERDALLEYLKTIDSGSFTVLLSQFYNRANNPPIPVFIWKD